MRKISNMFMLVAAAAMTFVSCQKEENRAPETVSATLTMHAGVDQTKTYLDEENTVLWGKGEAVKLYVGAGENEKFVSSTRTDAYDGAAIASFEFSITDLDAAESYNLGGIYPASATVDNKNPETYKVVLSDVQEAEVGKYDPSAYIMVLKPETVETLPTEYQASFRRATALNKITLTGVKEDISSVEITVPEGKDFAGRRYFNLMDGTSGDIYYGESNTITVKAPFTGSEIDVWFCSWGVELAAGDKLTVKLTATENTYTHTITAREQGIVFAEGDLNKLSINMTNVNADEQEQPEQPELPDGAAYYEKVTSEPADWSGQYLIVYENDATAYVFNGKDEENGFVSATIISNNKIVATSEIDAVAVTIEPMSGGYAIKTSAGYIYGNSSSNKLSFASSQQLNKIEYSSTNDVTITSGRVLRFNNASNQMRYRYYSSGSQQPIQLYRLAASNETPDLPDTTPAIVVSGGTSKSVEFGGGEVTFNYELKNLDGEELTWAVSGDEMISYVSAVGGVLSVTVAENAGDARTATITLSCGDAENVTLTIDQAKYVDLSVIQKMTVAEFATLNDGDAIYELSGTITGIYQAYNSSYNNISFYLKDDSRDEAIVIYRMSCEGIDHNKVVEGNVITVQGAKGSYNGTAQMAEGGVCVSLVEASNTPSISFENNIVSITATTGATIYYTINGDDPTTESSEYTASFEITGDTTVKAIAVEEGKLVSAVAVANCAWKDPNAAGDDAIVAPSGTILWAETWADAGSTSTSFANNTAISAYTYAGRTGFEDNATDVTYTADASNNVRITKSSSANCTSGHLWFNKSVAGELKTSAIKLYGATSVSFSHSQGTNGSSCQTSYSFDGGSTWTAAGTQSGPTEKKTYTITVPIGTESIMIKLTHASSNGKNTRVDNLELKVN